MIFSVIPEIPHNVGEGKDSLPAVRSPAVGAPHPPAHASRHQRRGARPPRGGRLDGQDHHDPSCQVVVINIAAFRRKHSSQL